MCPGIYLVCKIFFLSAPAGDVAVSAVRQFYDKLVLLPLNDKAPALYSNYLITKITLERVEKPCHVRAEKNGFILQDVIATVQLYPDRLADFCRVLQDVAAALAQSIRGIIMLFHSIIKMQFTDMSSRWCTVFGSVAVMCLELDRH